MTSMLIGALIGAACGHLVGRAMMHWAGRGTRRELKKWREIDRHAKSTILMQMERRARYGANEHQNGKNDQ